jgi:peptide chain release factor 1
MANGPDSETYVKLASEYSELEDIVGKIRDYQAATLRTRRPEMLLADKATDGEMRELAEMELPGDRGRSRRWKRTSSSCCCPRTRPTPRTPFSKSAPAPAASKPPCSPATCSACMSATPPSRGWKIEVISASEGDAGGYKEIIAKVSGRGVFSRLKFESGVHRVQRVPETEAGGRIHTSAATVAVLPQAEEVDVDIRDQDIRIDTMRASGRRRPARQHDRLGRAHHPYPDRHRRRSVGEVAAPEPRPRHGGPARPPLRHAERQKAADERAESRRVQVGSGDRSERIRTYNFPQGRLTDHRINLTLYKLDRIMEGELDDVIEPLIADHQAKLLTEEPA